MMAVDEQNRRRRISPFVKSYVPRHVLLSRWRCQPFFRNLPDSHLEDTVSTTNEGPL